MGFLRVARPLVIAVTVVAATTVPACGDDASTGDPQPVDGSQLIDESPGGSALDAELRPVTVVGTYRRFTAPDEPEVDRSAVMAWVPEELNATTWAAWGPTHEDDPQPPEVLENRQAILSWSAGSASAEIEGYRISGEGLVLVATVRRGAPDCVGPDFEDGYTIVLSTDDPEVTPGMDIAPPEITEVEVPC